MSLAGEHFWITHRGGRWTSWLLVVAWVGLLTGLPGTLPAVIVCGFLFLAMDWMGRLMTDQHVVVRPDGLLVAAPFQRLIPFDDIAYVRCLRSSKPAREYGWATFVKRKLVPAWDEPANIEVWFRRPVKLKLYPLHWYRQLVLTVDRPNEFVAALAGKVMVDTSDAGAMWTRTNRPPWWKALWSAVRPLLRDLRRRGGRSAPPTA